MSIKVSYKKKDFKRGYDWVRQLKSKLIIKEFIKIIEKKHDRTFAILPQQISRK